MDQNIGQAPSTKRPKRLAVKKINLKNKRSFSSLSKSSPIIQARVTIDDTGRDTQPQLTKSLEDQVRDLKIQNEQLERQKATKLLEEELSQLKLQNFELTRQIGREDQANQERMRSSQERNRYDIGQNHSNSVPRQTPQFSASPRYTSPTLQQALYQEEQYEGVGKLHLGDERLRWLKNFRFDIEDAKAQFLYFC